MLKFESKFLAEPLFGGGAGFPGSTSIVGEYHGIRLLFLYEPLLVEFAGRRAPAWHHVPILRRFFQALLDGNVLGGVSHGPVLLGLEVRHLHLGVPGLVLRLNPDVLIIGEVQGGVNEVFVLMDPAYLLVRSEGRQTRPLLERGLDRHLGMELGLGHGEHAGDRLSGGRAVQLRVEAWTLHLHRLRII